MTPTTRPTVVSLGDLVAAAVDAADTVTPDPRVAAQLATRTVARRLARARRLDLTRQLRAQEPVRLVGAPVMVVIRRAA
jgi:hypothetical protein